MQVAEVAEVVTLPLLVEPVEQAAVAPAGQILLELVELLTRVAEAVVLDLLVHPVFLKKAVAMVVPAL